MEIERDLERRFHERFFAWSQREWDREVGSSFERISTLRSVEAEAFVGVLQALPHRDVQQLALGLNKTRPAGSGTIVGDLVGGLRPEELQSVKRFRDAAWTRMSAQQLTGPGGAWAGRRAKPTVLRRVIRERLGDLVGVYEEFGDKGEWRYRTVIGPWKIYTHIDTSERRQQMIYHHSVRLSDTSYLLTSTSLLAWLGIMGSTRWNTLQVGQEEDAAELLLSLCVHFLGALPPLLEGL